jgi:hypothetical protein
LYGLYGPNFEKFDLNVIISRMALAKHKDLPQKKKIEPAPTWGQYNMLREALPVPDTDVLHKQLQEWWRSTWGPKCENSNAVKQLTMTIIMLIGHIWHITDARSTSSSADPHTLFKGAQYTKDRKLIVEQGVYTEGLLYAKLGVQVTDKELEQDVWDRVGQGEQILNRDRLGLAKAKVEWNKMWNKSTSRLKIAETALPELDMTSTCKSAEVICILVYCASVHRVLVCNKLLNNPGAEGNKFLAPTFHA